MSHAAEYLTNGTRSLKAKLYRNCDYSEALGYVPPSGRLGAWDIKLESLIFVKDLTSHTKSTGENCINKQHSALFLRPTPQSHYPLSVTLGTSPNAKPLKDHQILPSKRTTTFFMITTLLATVLVPLALTSAASAQKCRQPSEYAAAVDNLSRTLVQSAAVLNGSAQPPWAPGVIGRVDVTTTFIGQELNTEYLLGLFAETSDQNTTQIIGVPVNATLSELVIQPPLAYASVIFDFFQKTINISFPLQIDYLLRFDENLLISSYDATLRRFPQATKYMLPKLAVMMAQELNITITQETDIIKDIVTKRAAIDICNTEMEYCTGSNQQYANYDECYNFLTTKVPFGDPWEGGNNNTFCRYIHKNMLKFRPDVHCPHVGPSGGEMCIDRDYLDIVEHLPYNESLIGSSAEC
ncbi:hypothetical protein V5O48_017682 [Marasmius crinis-equi]|uniref:Uncharacterized protein n=1 Tax=Marasmius crinis-equi TaxID=585013 RepID=A0ABR3ENA5_9AGAR